MKTQRRSAMVLAVGAALALPMGIGQGARAQTPAPGGSDVIRIPLRKAAVKRVAVLPTVNATGQKDAARRRAESDRTDAEMRAAFPATDFSTARPTDVEKALKTARLDTSEPRNRSAESLSALGRSLGVDLVTIAVLEEAGPKDVRLRLHIVDVATGRALQDGAEFRRRWDDQPRVRQNNDGGWSSSVTLPPLSPERVRALIGDIIREGVAQARERQTASVTPVP